MPESPENTFVEGSSLWKDARHRMAQNKFAMASLGVIALMILFCFVFAWFCKDSNKVNLVNKFSIF